MKNISNWEKFNERYTRTVGFRYSDPTIMIKIEANSVGKIDPKKLINHF